MLIAVNCSTILCMSISQQMIVPSNHLGLPLRYIYSRIPRIAISASSECTRFIRDGAHHASFRESSYLFQQHAQEFYQTQHTYVFPRVIKACSEIMDLKAGSAIHAQVIKSGCHSDLYVVTALVDLYGKCNSLEFARQVFDAMHKRNVVLWNALIAGYSRHCYLDRTLILFRRMRADGLVPDVVTALNLIRVCSEAVDLQIGMGVHGFVVRTGLELDCFISNSLLDMYAKCGKMDSAEWFFEKRLKAERISWNSMIAGYTKNGKVHQALELFRKMMFVGMKPDRVTLLCILRACALLGFLKLGMEIHGYLIVSRVERDISAENSLISMYAKCKNMDVARMIFDGISARDSVSWSAIIGGYVHCGKIAEAMEIFREMQISAVPVNSGVMVNMISVYASSAALKAGKCMHSFVLKCGFGLNVEVGTALIDMYSKCGDLQIGRKIFDRIPQKNVICWTAMIDGYRLHGEIDQVIDVFMEMKARGLKPNYVTFISVLSACTDAGLLEKSWEIFRSMLSEHRIEPGVEHYACMVNLFAKSGQVENAHDLINGMS